MRNAGRSIMVLLCFAGIGQIAVVKGTMNFKVYQDILQDKVRTAANDLAG